MNNSALGLTLLAAGLLLFFSAINRSTGAFLAGLFYGKDALKNTPTKTPAKTPDLTTVKGASQAWSDPNQGKFHLNLFK